MDLYYGLKFNFKRQYIRYTTNVIDLLNQLNSLISSRRLLDEQPLGSKFAFLLESFKIKEYVTYLWGEKLSEFYILHFSQKNEIQFDYFLI